MEGWVLLNMDSMIGKTFGMWTVILRAKTDGKNVLFNCRCSCGLEKLVRKCHLVNGDSRSCGCWQHGHSKSLTYVAWQGMKQRCSNPRTRFFKRYGGRGIKVCERWIVSFENFLSDMGERPSGLTLDRRDNNGDYCKDNCRWATDFEQQSNTSRTRTITCNGETHHLSEWARIVGISANRILWRLERGWPVGRILSSKKFINQWR